jgi:pyruvate dehydrogenase (quinone)
MNKQENILDKSIKPQRIAYLLSKKCKKDAVIVIDTGNAIMWTARHFRIKYS